MIDAVVASGPANPRDWVGVYLQGADDIAYLDWRYLNGAQTPPAAGLTAAVVPFTMPSAPGTYELRFFAADGLQRLAVSSPITVN